MANVASLLVRTAQRWPRMPALAAGRSLRRDYASLTSCAASLAGGLRARGLAAGDTVLIASRNQPEYVEALFACWWAGLVAVPVNAKLHPQEMSYVQGDSLARFAFVDAAWDGELGDLPRVVLGGAAYARLAAHAPIDAPTAVAQDDPAWLFYTSGTTGRPKGVEITHGNLRAMSSAFLCDVEGIEPGDAILHPAPLSHGSGLYVVPHVARGAVSVIPESGGFDPDEVADLLDAWDRSLFFAAPTMVKRFVDADAASRANLDHLKCIVFGGGPMYVADCKAAFAALGPRLAQIYGQGETPMTITAMGRALLADAIARGDDARIASVGCAQTGIDIRIGGGDAIGEILVRGPTVMRGYWRNPEASRAALDSGWLHTGDVGTLSADGFLTLKDRSKDLIISGGSNIYPREVEEALLTHPDVAEVAVVGRVHAEWGEEVVAFVVARTKVAGDDAQRALEASLDAACLARIARFKRPKAYVFVAELPKNNTGKVVKTALREMLKT